MDDLEWDVEEVIVTSTVNFVGVFHPKTGKLIKSYKVNNIAPKCLELLAEEYFIGASATIPDIKMWPVRDEKSSNVVNSPCGLVNALTVTSCGTYCAAAFKKEIRVWNVQSGEMLAVFEKHYQDITVLKFTSDDSMFLSGGKDGTVQVWILCKVTSVNMQETNRINPLHSWHNHSKEVTDIYVGSLGGVSRVASTSADMTCKIYELDSGLLLTTVCLDVPVTAVTMDSLEYYLILGTQKGTISKINLYYDQPRELHNNTMEKDEVNAHTKMITSLSMSLNGNKFLSAAKDSNFKIWEVASLTCILCIPSNEGPYNNAFFSLHPTPLLTRQEPHFYVQKLERTFVSFEEKHQTSQILKPHNQKLSLIHAGSFDKHYQPTVLFGQEDVIVAEVAAEDAKTENAFQEAFRGETLNEVRDINAQMYTFLLSEVFKSITPKPDVSRQPEEMIE